MNRKDSNIKKRKTSIDNILEYIEPEHNVVDEIKIFFGNGLMAKSTSILSEINVNKLRKLMITMLKDEKKYFDSLL